MYMYIFFQRKERNESQIYYVIWMSFNRILKGGKRIYSGRSTSKDLTRWSRRVQENDNYFLLYKITVENDVFCLRLKVIGHLESHRLIVLLLLFRADGYNHNAVLCAYGHIHADHQRQTHYYYYTGAWIRLFFSVRYCLRLVWRISQKNTKKTPSTIFGHVLRVRKSKFLCDVFENILHKSMYSRGAQNLELCCGRWPRGLANFKNTPNSSSEWFNNTKHHTAIS